MTSAVHTVDRVLSERLKGAQRRTPRFVFGSALCHTFLVLTIVFLPRFFVKPPPKIEAISVTVVPPRALGIESPPAKKPKQPETKPTPAQKPPEKPADEPKPKPSLTKVPDATKPLKSAPSEAVEKNQPTPPEAPKEKNRDQPAEDGPIKRQGSPFGNPLGASTQRAALGAEDPNFTYGYYLDRVVSLISANWVRPVVGPEIQQSLVYFRIQQNGTITDLRQVEGSGSEIFDQAALRAVEASSPLPPLPKGYKKDHLGIHLIVK